VSAAEPVPRRLRADARLNQDRVLEAAAAMFARTGADTSMKAVAREAGVGIATLYRRFPTRETLVEAVYRNETTTLAESATGMLAHSTPPVALRTWFRAFLTYMSTKNGMAEALPAILADRDGLRLHSRDVLRTAIAQIPRTRARPRHPPEPIPHRRLRDRPGRGQAAAGTASLGTGVWSRLAFTMKMTTSSAAKSNRPPIRNATR
jgi:AcrR family transcriptional regulator